MDCRMLTEKDVLLFREHLVREEKSAVTVEKYLRDIPPAGFEESLEKTGK